MIADNTNTITNHSLTVMVTGLKHQKGQVGFILFAEGEGFPDNSKNRSLATCYIQATETPLEVTFNNLTAGMYAASVLHDANEDGILNTGFLGIPLEGFGFSNNPKIRMSPPTFKDAQILVSGDTKIQINLKYFF